MDWRAGGHLRLVRFADVFQARPPQLRTRRHQCKELHSQREEREPSGHPPQSCRQVKGPHMDTVNEHRHVLEAGVDLQTAIYVALGAVICVMVLAGLWKLISVMQERRLACYQSNPCDSWPCATAEVDLEDGLVADEEKVTGA